jgi:hypothetical protein
LLEPEGEGSAGTADGSARNTAALVSTGALPVIAMSNAMTAAASIRLDIRGFLIVLRP